MSDDLAGVTKALNCGIVTAIQRENKPLGDARRSIIARIIGASVGQRDRSHVWDGENSCQETGDGKQELGKGRHCEAVWKWRVSNERNGLHLIS